MFFDYFDMLSGEPVLLNGVGHIRSPRLKDIAPYRGIGYKNYNLYLNYLSWDRDSLLKYCQIMKCRGVHKVDRPQFEVFDIATLLRETRDLYGEMLSFFIVENIAWVEKHRAFVIHTCDTGLDNLKPDDIVGIIDRNNFEEVRRIILQFNYIGLEKKTEGDVVSHSCAKSQELWELAQKHLSAQAKEAPGKTAKQEYHMSNIISKLCAAHPSYNLLNVFDLTVFQLYDSLFQFGDIKSSNLSERIFSNHGGDKFKFEDWLKPIINNL